MSLASQVMVYDGETLEPLNLERLVLWALLEALLTNSMNLSRAAKALGINRSTLYRMIEKHDEALKAMRPIVERELGLSPIFAVKPGILPTPPRRA